MRPIESRAQQALLQAKGLGGELLEPRSESRAHDAFGRATGHCGGLDPVPGQGQEGGREVAPDVGFATTVLAKTNDRAISCRMTEGPKGDRTRSRILDEAVQLASVQ